MELSPQDLAQLIDLERDLATPGRLSPATVNALLAEDFYEIGASGKTYNKQQTLDALAETTLTATQLDNFKGHWVTDDVVVLLFHSLRESNEGPIQALRSSLWQKVGNNWVLRFHQASRLDPA